MVSQISYFEYIITLPFSIFNDDLYIHNTTQYRNDVYDYSSEVTINSIPSSFNATSSKDYSSTNIQVLNVDEADITKTDGDYIYSISDNNVIITNVINPKKIKIEATIKSLDESVPEDLILYNNKLVIISSKNDGSRYRYNKSNAIIRIYDISTKSSPKLVKNYELYEPYYTSRRLDNKLYVIASGKLRVEKKKVIRTYKEDNLEKQIALNDFKYLKNVETNNQTLMSIVDLDKPKENVKINSFLIDISNAYVSENSIYLLNESYYSSYTKNYISKIFGIKGIFGLSDYENDYYDDENYQTEVYTTIDQYSLDEKDGHLRIASYDEEGAKITIFDSKLKQIGKSENVGKDEEMYSTRFIGNKAYLVTYKTIDPLFVIDLSNEKNPKVLGQLYIPGYSTYLHPYDENHLIGIGMETKKIINKDISGKVISTTDRIVGMKMALFDVSNVKNPKEISKTVIGDSRTTSAVLTNPKALLFSKEKNLLAIPVNNYEEDFELDIPYDTYSSVIDSYINYDKTYNAEGYYVYNINLEDGFKLKGVITHNKKEKNYYSSYYYDSKLLRGLYIENNLFTISEDAIKVNNLENLELINELKIK